MRRKKNLLLAGDIGGTKTIVALYDRAKGPRWPVAEETFPSQQFESLAEIVRVFMAGKDALLAGAVFGVAGPVVAGRARVTNLPWLADAQELGELLDAPITLLNDLECIGHAVPFLEGDDLVTLNAGEPEPRGTRAVFAPGTGLGEGFLVWDGRRYRPCPSEGGHADFAPTTPLEIELLAYWQKRLDHVSYERVCSGLGIPNLYRFLKDSGRYSEPAWLAEQLAAAAD